MYAFLKNFVLVNTKSLLSLWGNNDKIYNLLMRSKISWVEDIKFPKKILKCCKKLKAGINVIKVLISHIMSVIKQAKWQRQIFGLRGQIPNKG